MMDRAVIGIPPGFRDILHEEASARRRVISAFAAVFDGEGYREILPSAVEYQDLYERGHQSLRQRVVRFLDRDDNLLALRADFTPAIARIVGGPLAGEIPPLKLWYAGSVFRRAGSSRGEMAELAQVGAELVGDSSIEADAGLLDLLFSALDRLGVRNIKVHLNHAGIFRGILRELDLAPGTLRALRTEIDRKDVRTLTGRLEALGVQPEFERQLRQISRLAGPASVLQEAANTFTNRESLAAIESLMALAERLATWQGRLTFDLTGIDELEYYTGVMFSAYLPTLNRELGRGGRYDTLLREFGRDLPAVGFSISVDSLLEIL